MPFVSYFPTSNLVGTSIVVAVAMTSNKPKHTLNPNRFDARGKPLSMGRRWSEVASFGLRADFRFALHGQIPSKGHLVINRTTLADEGIYRCRVDFKNSPARHYRVQLNVTGESARHVLVLSRYSSFYDRCTFSFIQKW